MRTIATLSLAAFEVLWEGLRAGSIPYPFEIDQHGYTLDERARIKVAVHADLERHGLARHGRPEPELEDALNLLARPELRITALGMPSIEDGALLRASVVARGGYAVMFVQDGLSVTLSLVRDNALATALVNVLPQRRPGPGKPVTVPASAFGQATPRQGITQAVRSGGNDDLKALQAMLSSPMVGTGHFVVVLAQSGGKKPFPPVTWFDTTEGRYVNMPSRNGPDWHTVAPVDNNGLAQCLSQVLAMTSRR